MCAILKVIVVYAHIKNSASHLIAFILQDDQMSIPYNQNQSSTPFPIARGATYDDFSGLCFLIFEIIKMCIQ